MENIKVLDCTLRDGGRVIDCRFRDDVIKSIAGRLSQSQIDIVEMGFLRDARDISYQGDSTFFTDVGQIAPFLPEIRGNTIFAAFIDYGMYDFNNLKPCDGTSVDGIRLGFKKADYTNSREDVVQCLKLVKELGYKLFIQGVNTLAYSDFELLELIRTVNDIRPYSFGIVDTYGAMYVEDARRIFGLVDHNLKQDICIDLHSHNNFQLSFAIAQEIVGLVGNSREIILDATLNGMGKCAGNLNTELLVDYLVRIKNCDYEIDTILDIIDDYIAPIKKKAFWGYTVPAFMAGVYKAHPNNVIYMTEKHRMETKDIRHIMAIIEEPVRQIYDYDNIERIYIKYMNHKVDDSDAMEELHRLTYGKEVLLLVPGNSLVTYRKQIEDYICGKKSFVISVNFVSDIEDAYCFVGYKKRYDAVASKQDAKFILPSNVCCDQSKGLIVNYEGLINRGYKLFDNSTMMLLNLLRKAEVGKILIAGFDGFRKEQDNNFVDYSFDNERHISDFDEINEELTRMMEEYMSKVRGKADVKFLTPSLYCRESVLS